MAKTAAKTSAKEPKKTATTAKKAPTASASVVDIEKASKEALEKLKELDIDAQLQSDLEWCLGSFKADNNPVGLYSMIERALIIFKEEKAKKTKGITAKLVTDLEKAIKR
jgi:hypothetical protein